MNEINNEHNENLDTGDTAVKNRSFFAWLDNFWYHYKWHSLLSLFLVFTVTICTLQMCRKESYDIHILYAGEQAIDRTRGEDISDYDKISQYLTRNATDRNKDGKTLVAFKDLYILDESDMKPGGSDKDNEDGKLSDSDYQRTYNDREALRNIMLSGNYYVCLFSHEVYESYRDSGALMNLNAESILGEGADVVYYDDTMCGIYLSSTAFAKQYPICTILPEDTVLCLKRVPYAQTGKKDYKASVEYIKNMVSLDTAN